MNEATGAGGRLPLLQAAFVVARRDFTAILFGRAFIFFLLGPLFPAVVMALAGGVGAQVQSGTASATIGVAMAGEDMDRLLAARADLARRVALPPMVELQRLAPGEAYDAKAVLEGREGQLAAIVTGTLAAPELTATQGRLDQWAGVVALIAAYGADSAGGNALDYPVVATSEVASSGAVQSSSRIGTAQGAQVLLFLLIMMLASMVLSNLVEEKGNKIIEVLAAAIPMDAVFFGKLFAMLGISLVGIAVWGGTAALILLAGGMSLADYAEPGVGWPLFLGLFAVYFAMGYLLLGAIFLTIGSQAKTVREVQTLSMPATMLQILVFFLASLTVTNTGGWIEYTGMVFPLSSPFVMIARAATAETLWPHAIALAWQGLCVALFVKVGANLFRRRVMQSGSPANRGAFRNGSAKTA